MLQKPFSPRSLKTASDFYLVPKLELGNERNRARQFFLCALASLRETEMDARPMRRD